MKFSLLAFVLCLSTAGAALAQRTDEPLMAEVDSLYVYPDFKCIDMEGREVLLTNYLNENYTIVEFWGSWCRYCIADIPAMKEAYAQYHPLGLQFVGICCRETQESWKEAVEKYGLPWTNLYYPEQGNPQLTPSYEFQGYPTKYVVAPGGIVMCEFLGDDPAFYEYLKYIFSE